MFTFKHRPGHNPTLSVLVCGQPGPRPFLCRGRDGVSPRSSASHPCHGTPAGTGRLETCRRTDGVVLVAYLTLQSLRLRLCTPRHPLPPPPPSQPWKPLHPVRGSFVATGRRRGRNAEPHRGEPFSSPAPAERSILLGRVGSARCGSAPASWTRTGPATPPRQVPLPLLVLLPNARATRDAPLWRFSPDTPSWRTAGRRAAGKGGGGRRKMLPAGGRGKRSGTGLSAPRHSAARALSPLKGFRRI